MSPAVFWPASSFAFVLGLALMALGALVLGDPEGRGWAIADRFLAPGLLLAGSSVVAVLGRLVRAAWRRWRP